MSIDCRAAMSHNQTIDKIYALPELLTPAWHEIGPFLLFDGGTIRPAPNGLRWQYYWKWQDVANAAELKRAFEANECVLLEAIGPESFVFAVTQNALIWEPFFYRWYAFCEDGTVTERIRGICAHLAHILGANRVFYLPDSSLPASRAYEMLCYEGRPLDEANEWLRRNCGPPAQVVGDLLTGSGELSPCGYFADKY